MGLAPWSTSVELTWKPSLRYYQQRFDLLGDVEALTGVRDYAFGVDDVVARLDAPGWAELVLRRDGLGLHRRLPEGGWEELILAARLILGRIGPQVDTHVTLYNQYLVDIPDMTYDDARRRCGQRMSGPWAAEVGLEDWAFLVDGTADGHEYQTEFGVVERNEIPLRLSRFAGRTGGPQIDVSQLLAEVQPEDVPLVAFFSDFTWRRAPVVGDQDLTEYCTDLIDRSTVIVAKIFDVATTDRGGSNAKLEAG